MLKPFRPEILLTNDDGFESPQLVSLALSLSKVASVHVVSPETEQSGVSHAFKGFLGHELRRIPGDYPFDFYSLSGAPADCTKMGLRNLYREHSIDCVISGPNAGENAGVSSLYSGTVAGAREAALWGKPGIALSLCTGSSEKMLAELCRFAVRIVEERLYGNISSGTVWNVNFPRESVPFRGYRVAPQNLSMFTDHYEEKDGKYFLEGKKLPEHFIEASDDDLLEQGFATITPITIDQTAHGELLPVETALEKLLAK